MGLVIVPSRTGL